MQKFAAVCLTKCRLIIALSVGILFSVVSLCLCSYLWIYLQSRRLIHYQIDDVPQATYALVLGAKVERDGRPSKILRQRLDAAKLLYDGHKVKTIIVSGGVGEQYDEAEAMRNYLVSEGVSTADIELDKEGTNTYHSCKNYKLRHEDKELIVVTSAYHLPRTAFLAQGLGLRVNAYPAPDLDHNFLTRTYNFVRESLSRVKAVLNLYLFPEW